MVGKSPKIRNNKHVDGTFVAASGDYSFFIFGVDKVDLDVYRRAIGAWRESLRQQQQEEEYEND